MWSRDICYKRTAIELPREPPSNRVGFVVSAYRKTTKHDTMSCFSYFMELISVLSLNNRGSVADLDFSIYTLRIYSRLQPLTSISGTLPQNGAGSGFRDCGSV